MSLIRYEQLYVAGGLDLNINYIAKTKGES